MLADDKRILQWPENRLKLSGVEQVEMLHRLIKWAGAAVISQDVF